MLGLPIWHSKMATASAEPSLWRLPVAVLNSRVSGPPPANCPLWTCIRPDGQPLPPHDGMSSVPSDRSCSVTGARVTAGAAEAVTDGEGEGTSVGDAVD